MRCVVLLLTLALSGCADDVCDDLAAICERCPDDEEGRVARASCRAAVEAADERACEDRVEQRTYAAYGCR